jgi:GNAT superfamily N-acetyltransferase
MIVRAATTDDVPAVAAVLEASGETSVWPGIPGWPYVEHLVARARVPVAVVDDEIIGMAGSLEIGHPDVRFLSDLFVHPDRQDHGAGRALLAAAFAGSAGRLTFSSADPRALGLYLRAGLRPWWPLLYVRIPGSALGPDDPGLAVEPGDVAATGHWSRAWTGMDRTVDFAHYRMLPGGSGQIVIADGRPAAIVWSNRRRTAAGRAVDHVSIAPDADPLSATEAALRGAIGDADELIASIPAPHPAIAGLLDRGARIVDRDQFCASDPTLLDPERLLPNPGFF